jgi:hypothetical protein
MNYCSFVNWLSKKCHGFLGWDFEVKETRSIVLFWFPPFMVIGAILMKIAQQINRVAFKIDDVYNSVDSKYDDLLADSKYDDLSANLLISFMLSVLLLIWIGIFILPDTNMGDIVLEGQILLGSLTILLFVGFIDGWFPGRINEWIHKVEDFHNRHFLVMCDSEKKVNNDDEE